MRILMVTAEFAPLAKVGGLADMVAGLSAWLATEGHEVRVILPAYGVTEAPALRRATPDQAPPGLEVFELIAPEHFGDPAVYLGDDRDALRFALFGEAALAHAQADGFHPDVIHAHDWHAAAAVALPGPWTPSPPTLLTLHNIGYQGIFGLDALPDGPLREALRDPTVAEPRLNFLAAGIARATTLTTVSPTHASEILTAEYGAGLEGLLRERVDRLRGILNGVDYGLWSPANDPLIEHAYSAETPDGKAHNRAALLEALGLVVDDQVPIVGMITRLTGQKGIDLLIEALPGLVAAQEFSLVILGMGEPRYVEALRMLAEAHPGAITLLEAHDERLAHRLLAGSDLLLMPSRYEPCGLTQLYAMRYGTIPVVRATGGLADSVQHFDPATGEGTGVVFRDYDVGGISWGLGQALAWFAAPALWSRVVANAMRTDFSW
ncbi:MAG: glycogen/starch synthase, partial [Gammaproteobacteria bacterium]|nr:glycogen/starch synthase [Gammaproteobacteria bacterium]